MEKYFNSISNISAVIGGVIVYLLGGWDILISTLVVLMCLDFVTGLLKGFYNKKLSSQAGIKGIIKKVCILIVVSLAVMCEKIGIPAMREMTIIFFAVNEGLSILENASELDLPIPEVIKNALVKLREKDGE